MAYWYYLIILGGIVWNILGSCWIKAAFVYYPRGFSACYLVCVILSWISVIASPCFVFFGRTLRSWLSSQVDCCTHDENKTFLFRKGTASSSFPLRTMCPISMQS